MRNSPSKFTYFIKKHKILSVIAAVLVTLCTWWAFVNFMPHPLGDKLEYLGKTDLGGIIFGDSQPYSVYYYGTDMEPQDMSKYFDAQYSPLENLAFKNAHFTTSNGEFSFTYETSGSFSTPKKYIVSIVDLQYNIAKEHLKNN